MKFLRIGEDSFKCMVTSEDLQLIGCTFTDIVKDQAGLQSLLDMVIEEAEDKIGYVIDSTRVVVNLQLVDSSSAVVTVSSCNEDKDFPELPPWLSQVPGSLLGNAVQDTRQYDAPDSFAENKIIFCFESFKNLEGYAAAYPFATGIFNSVYNLVYSVDEQGVNIYQCKGHYDDKYFFMVRKIEIGNRLRTINKILYKINKND